MNNKNEKATPQPEKQGEVSAEQGLEINEHDKGINLKEAVGAEQVKAGEEKNSIPIVEPKPQEGQAQSPVLLNQPLATPNLPVGQVSNQLPNAPNQPPQAPGQPAPWSQQPPPPGYRANTLYGQPWSPPPPKKPRVYTLPEKWLLAVAIILAFLFDRLVIALGGEGSNTPFFFAIFWICFTIGYHIFNWDKLKNNKVLWIVTAFNLLLCFWNFLFDYRSAYGGVVSLVIPAVLMAHAQFSQHNLTLNDGGKLVANWFTGWFVEPFTGISHFFGSAKSVMVTSEKSNLKKVLIGIGISLPALLVILPLLSQADMVFSYYLDNLFYDFSLFDLTIHIIVVVVLSMLLYSFFWNGRFAEKAKKNDNHEKKQSFDPLIVGVALSVVLVVYLLFCTVQFTYLFAGAGLPNNMTYSDYAREGFAQINIIAAINLTIFGIVLAKTKQHKAIVPMLAALLAMTAVMLVSGMVRLGLYMETFMLTWLRILSAWFIIYLMIVLVLCAVKLLKPKFSTIGTSAIVLLIWFTVLGYSNPDALIMKYNLAKSKDPTSWVSDNEYYIYNTLSDDARIVLYEQGFELVDYHTQSGTIEKAEKGNSFASYRLHKIASKRK